MGRVRWVLAAMLLLLAGAVTGIHNPSVTGYGGWPGCALILAAFGVVGRRAWWSVALGSTAVLSGAVAIGYEVPLTVSIPAAALTTGAAFIGFWLLSRGGARPIRGPLDNAESVGFTTTISGVSLGIGVFAGVAGAAVYGESLTIGFLTAFLATLSGLLVVLPLFSRHEDFQASGPRLELLFQGTLLLIWFCYVFLVPGTVAIAVVGFFPFFFWGCARGRRVTAERQLALLSTGMYVATLAGLGPFAHDLTSLGPAYSPLLLFLVIVALGYSASPSLINREDMQRAVIQANLSARTVDQLIASAAGILIIATDVEGNITHVNAGALAMLGYAREELLGHHVGMLLSAEQRRVVDLQDRGTEPERWQQALDRFVDTRYDWELARRDGLVRQLSCTFTRMHDGQGHALGYVCVGEDLTDRIRAEKALRTTLDREAAAQARLLEIETVKEELVSNFSHELRTPITSIAGYAEVLADGSVGELNEPQARMVERIERNSVRLGRLLEDLLILAKSESGALEPQRGPCDLRAVVNDAVELVQSLGEASSLAVTTSLPDSPVVIEADGAQLERVVLNLLTNAIKYSVSDAQVETVLDTTETTATISVTDHGIGMSRKDLDLLFTRFFRGSTAVANAIQGNGLGLSIVNEIVISHGGEIRVASTEGEGTTFTVILPLDAVAPAERTELLGTAARVPEAGSSSGEYRAASAVIRDPCTRTP